MSRVVPSQVVDLIDKLFPWAKDQKEGTTSKWFLSAGNLCSVAAVLDLLEQLSPELIILQREDYAEFTSSVAALKVLIPQWQNNYDFGYHRIPGLRDLSPIALIRQALEKCPDEFPSASTSELTFIADANLRDNLRLDISTTNSSLRNGEWKAATVLAGSIVEALLLWSLQRETPGDISASAAKLRLNISSNLEKWNLHEYIEVAADMKLIESDTANQCRLAKDFRNLIHPGRAQRLGQVCNRGTALSAVAAVEHVVNDLTP
jgi:hypothetical protein